MRSTLPLCLLLSADALAQTCPAPVSFTDSFGATTYRDASSTVGGWGSGQLRLPGNPDLTQGESGSTTSFGFPAGWSLHYGVAGDLNADGLPDLVMMTESCD